MPGLPPPRWALRAPGVWGSPRGLRLPRPAGAPGHPLRAGTPPFPALALRPASPAWVWGERDPSAGSFGRRGHPAGPPNRPGHSLSPLERLRPHFSTRCLGCDDKEAIYSRSPLLEGAISPFPSLPDVPSLSQPSPSHPNTFSACASLLYEKNPNSFLLPPSDRGRGGIPGCSGGTGALRRGFVSSRSRFSRGRPPWAARGGTKRLGIFAG